MTYFRFLLLLVLLGLPSLTTLAPVARAQTPVVDETEQPLNSPALEARAVALGKKLRCVVCQSESINDSQADMARDMRQLVREKISYGWSDNDVMEFLRQRYGDYILLQPRMHGSALLLWLAPLALLGLGGWAAFIYLRRKQIDIVQLARIQAGHIYAKWQKAQATLKEAKAAGQNPPPATVSMWKTSKPLAEAIGASTGTPALNAISKPKPTTAKKRTATKKAVKVQPGTNPIAEAETPHAADIPSAPTEAVEPVKKPRARKPRVAKPQEAASIGEMPDENSLPTKTPSEN